MVWQPMATGAPFSSVIEACLQVYKRSNSMIAIEKRWNKHKTGNQFGDILSGEIRQLRVYSRHSKCLEPGFRSCICYRFISTLDFRRN